MLEHGLHRARSIFLLQSSIVKYISYAVAASFVLLTLVALNTVLSAIKHEYVRQLET
ncbi:hypothetical protein SISSUDRAFT_1067151 [Sistotremastrum suecicum HHB10207 ss-3]|uniref:Uncharacterized protein n=1 Tax=Sistotremastrum suecicum HHB10207 ss-3 TaxID=1314776 RepID=A0A165XG18_9AGAM|nr:hypothetical protein SISSUDRAFT_1067151 [Sistotremastrum suecicum HHB10207 ss-3]